MSAPPLWPVLALKLRGGGAAGGDGGQGAPAEGGADAPMPMLPASDAAAEAVCLPPGQVP